MKKELYYTKHKLGLNIIKTQNIENDVNFFTYDLTNLENSVNNIQQTFKQNTDISNNIFIGNDTLINNKGYWIPDYERHIQISYKLNDIFGDLLKKYLGKLFLSKKNDTYV